MVCYFVWVYGISGLVASTKISIWHGMINAHPSRRLVDKRRGHYEQITYIPDFNKFRRPSRFTVFRIVHYQ